MWNNPGNAKIRYLTDEQVTDREASNDTARSLNLFFNSKMTVTEQFWSYGFMAYIAENGGFVGLFLGYSLLQLEELITFCSKKFQSEKEEIRNNSAVSASSADQNQLEKEVFD